MHLPELTKAVAARTGRSVSSLDGVVAAVFDAIRAELRNGGEVSIRSFGTLRVVQLPDREAQHFRTGERFVAKGRRKPKLIAARGVLDEPKVKRGKPGAYDWRQPWKESDRDADCHHA